MKTLGCILLVLTALELYQCADIFIISNLPSGSHAIWYGKMANLLAQRGHQVVMLGTGPYKAKSDNVSFILMEDSYVWLKELETVLEKTPLLDIVGGLATATDNIFATSDWHFTNCERFIQKEGVKTAIEKYRGKRFDLIIMDFPCESFAGFVPFFGNPPLILATPYNNAFNLFDTVGLHDNPSYVPSPFSPFQPAMTFTQRALNLYYKLYANVLWQLYNVPKEDAASKKMFGSSTPHVNDIMKNASLLLLGIDPVLTGAKPLPPAYIPIGGFHIDKVKPLPQDIKKFIDDAKDGVIYFSFGSNFKSVFMTPEMIKVFLETFKELPQRVVWKLEYEDNTGIPSNVMISKWLPQNDILGHPNVRCFISHGGLLGTQEAIHHGVPILGLPFMFDQLDVLQKLEFNGVGVRMNFHKLTKSYIKECIQRILGKSYRDKMQEWSRMFKDSPQTPEERAIWWIEYVLRNPEETKKYLRSSSMDLFWFQRLLLDVAVVVVVPVLIVLFLICSLARFIFRKCRREDKSSKIKRKNKKE